MEYYATFSVIDDRYGFMGVEEACFDAEDMEELREQFKEFYDTHDTKIIYYLLDSIQDEEGNDIDEEPFIRIEEEG